MKVLHVTNTYPIPSDLTFGIYVDVLIRALDEAGIQNEVLQIHGYRSRWNYVHGNWEVSRAVRQGRFDLVHVHSGLTLFCMGRAGAIPRIVSFYGSDLMHPVQNRICNALAPMAHLHTVQSLRMARRLYKYPAIILPTGIDLRLFKPIPRSEARAALGISHEYPIAAFVANPANPVKQFHIAKTAVNRVKALGIQIDLASVYGEPHEIVKLWMNAADVLLVTSKWEGSPNIVKEALACNLPVISFDIGDVAERLEGVTPSWIVGGIDEMVQRISEIVRIGGRSNGREIVSALDLPVLAGRLIGNYERLRRGIQRRG